MKTMFEKVQDAINDIETALSRSPELGDAGMAIRVIGEFSAGKTRFVKEMLRDIIPEALQPVSSQEVQTRLPLEITYGEIPSLKLVRRAYDTVAAETIRSFAVFPKREELAELEPQEQRLRLYVPEIRLTLANGDGMNEGDLQPKRLFLIDMPGWNSEDDVSGADGLGFSEDWENLALVYVSHINRLDSAVNQRQLKYFLEALCFGELRRARDRLPVLFVITACPADERQKVEKQQEERIRQSIPKKYIDKFFIKVIAVDFKDITSSELAAVRNTFWKHVLLESPSPALKQDNIIEQRVASWPNSYALRTYFDTSIHALDSLSAYLSRVRKNNSYMKGRTMHFFVGLDASGITSRAKSVWYNQIKAMGLRDITDIALPSLPQEHPLNPWLKVYWLPRIHQAFDSIKHFFEHSDKVLDLLTPEIEDLQKWLHHKLDDLYLQAYESLTKSFLQLCREIESFSEDMPELQRMATILALSLIEARYDDARNRWGRILNLKSAVSGIDFK